MRVLLITAAGLAVMAPAASAAGTGVVPISLAEGSFAGLQAAPPARFGDVGSTVTDLGDVNGDGISDVAVGDDSVDAPGRRDAGVVYVVFGGSPLGRLDLGTAPGFQIAGPRQGARRPVPAFAFDGPPAGAMAGAAVAAAGDVNADGLADIVVGAPFAGRNGRAFSGSAYVVFGKRSAERVDLERLGSGGFRIDGPRRGAVVGTTLAGTGDVNGDGRADVVVRSDRVQRAAVYVVFGKASAEPVDLRRLGRRGFAIRRGGGWRDLLHFGDALSGAGDFNGDGLADVAIGAPGSGGTHGEGAGVTFVVFGGRRMRTVELLKLGRRGVRIEGEQAFANTGEALAPLGDVNGDGRGDLLLGASQVAGLGRNYAGAAYVVFGRAGAGRVDLLRPGAAAYRILGPATTGGVGQARAGMDVAAIDDVNGDGRRDILIGAPGVGRRCAGDEGAAFVVFSSNVAAPVDLGDLGTAGYEIRGGLWDANAGAAVASAGDWNRDGRGDALVLRTDFDGSRRGQAPRLDLLLGRDPPPVPAPVAPPRLEIANPTLRALGSRGGLDARVTVDQPGDVLVEVRYANSPIAVGLATASQPGTTAVKVLMPADFRRVLARRTRLTTRVIVSQCTAAGYEYSATSGVTLSRAGAPGSSS